METVWRTHGKYMESIWKTYGTENQGEFGIVTRLRIPYNYPMALLSISLLGSFQVFLDGELVENFESNKVRGLLAYLAVERDQPQSREKLATLLWPDCSDKTARSNLRNVIFKLRKAIRVRCRASISLHYPSEFTIQFGWQCPSRCVDVF